MWQPIVNPISYKRNHSTMKTNNINLFCDIVTQRSGEHSCAINILLQQQLYGQVISILRQELDSMVRVMFLLSISDLNLREHFINQTLEGIKWSYPNTKKVVTDKQMVDLADKFYGWHFFVYKLGCALFIFQQWYIIKTVIHFCFYLFQKEMTSQGFYINIIVSR